MSGLTEETQDNKEKIMSLFADVQSDMATIDEAITKELSASNELLTDVSVHLLKGGGKRLRPALVLLTGKLGDYDREKLVAVAAAVEIIHMATLVHDDVVDRSLVRRGVPTVNARWGERVSVLTGDFLFARSFSLLAQQGDNDIVKVMANVVSEMSIGEFEQMTATYDWKQEEQKYFERINKKTAFFIAESCWVGGYVAGLRGSELEAIRKYGYGVGMSFQIIDDILDFTASEEELGKPVGSDLRSGILTLPVIYALQVSPQAKELQEIINSRKIDNKEVWRVKEILTACNALEYSYDKATEYIDMAKKNLGSIEKSERIKDSLDDIATFVIARRF